MTGNVERGTVVRALAGREKGRFMIAVGCEAGCVLLADGDERKLAAPKRKNVKHVAATGTVVDMDDISDKKIRQILSGYQA